MAQTLHTHTGEDGLLIVRFDRPGRDVNTFTPDVLDELEHHIETLEHDGERVPGVVFTSSKAGTFIVGADLFELAEMDRAAAQRFLERGQALFERIAKLPMPTVAAINGHCLGGGMELALACRARVAVDDGSIRIGLPETKLGLIPGWGGTTRVTEMLGPIEAMKLLLPGGTLPPRKAQRRRVIDEVMRPEALMRAAGRLVQHPPRRPGPPAMLDLAMRVPYVRRQVFERARKQTQQRTGGHYPAADALIDVVQRVIEHGHDAGLEDERRALLELFDSDSSRNLIRLFFLRHHAKEAAEAAAPAAPRTVRRAAVVGGGTMGAGIAHALVTAGLPVRLVEVDHDAMSKALRRIRGLLEDDRRDGRLTALELERAMRRVSPTMDWLGLSRVDFAIEAAAEKPAVKREIFQKLGELTGPDVVLATNTSALDITQMAHAAGRPGRVIGLHFFNPVAKMMLVEVVRTGECDDEAIATGVAVARTLGKTPIVVGHGPAFLVNRLVLPQFAEALHLVREGVSPSEIDRAMRAWGMPMGPCELLDHVGLDIAVDILEALKPMLGDRFAVPAGLAQAVQRGWLGHKSGRGFYIYPGEWEKRFGRRPQPNEELLRLLRPDDAVSSEGAGVDEAQMQRRLILPMVNEAARVLVEGITDSTQTIDLAMVLGLGFAPFRGGLVHYAESVGLDTIVSQLNELAERHGDRFASVRELARVAAEDRPMQELSAHAMPLRDRADRAARDEARTDTQGGASWSA